MFENAGIAIIYGIISTFILALITMWVARLNIKSDKVDVQPTEAPHH